MKNQDILKILDNECKKYMLNWNLRSFMNSHPKLLTSITEAMKASFIRGVRSKRTTPEMVTELKENEIFVFGSNLQGKHIGGAAKIAEQKFGAKLGVAFGKVGQTFAIPTVDFEGHINLEEIKGYVEKFLDSASQWENVVFLVTPIGCGIAGFKIEEIAPMFRRAIEMDNVYLPNEFWEYYER